jgi:transcriptional regulator with XRE-family HTH domain
MDIDSWVVFCRKKLKWTQDELSIKLGVSKATISSWETGKYIPKMQSIITLAAFANEKLPAKLNYETAEFYATSSAKIFYKDVYLQPTEDTLIVDVHLKDCFAWRVLDTSLEKVCRKDDVVIVEPNVEFKPTDYVLIRANKTIYVRKIKIIDYSTDHFQFLPENELFPTLDNKVQDIEIIGVCKEVRRTL